MKNIGQLITALLLSVAAIIAVSLGSCHSSNSENKLHDSLAIKKDLTSPQLSPEESIKKMHLEDGFTIKLVAAEPLTVAPVALNFDDKGRIWVVEMVDFMPDTAGTGEDKPTGKVVILSDKNGDGVMDERKVFLDSLVLPRAICLIENGILVAESPNLWYYDIKDDKAVNKTLVDAAYADGGNVEHQPNGLLRGLDNWIYNAKSSKRYRKKGNRWLIEKTHFRGQWGITQDDQGRLFYNTNSENLLGDFFSPGLGAYNVNQRGVAGYVTKIVADNRVYPARPTPGVNRGYVEGVLDDSLRLVNFTAACAPMIYNGTLFNKGYYGNAFVAEPSANLIKRNILNENDYAVEGKEAYEKREFLASEDERFRPVNLQVGPGGAMYVVDIYRGILQHKTYLTPYLKKEIQARNLTQPLSCGRIYKIIPTDKKEDAVTVPKEPSKLVSLLGSPNGWLRNKAQQQLVDGKYKEVATTLRSNLKAPDNVLALTHSLWTLEGLDMLQSQDVLPLLTQPNWKVRVQALSVVPSVINRNNYKDFLPVLQQLINNNDTLAAPYIGFLIHALQPYNSVAAKLLLMSLTKRYPANIYVADAVISNLQNKEVAYYKEALTYNADTSLAINKRLKKVIDDIAKAKNNSNTKNIAKEYPKGIALFSSICQTCHGPDGNGVPTLAPPLNGSGWVTGDKNKLISIVLYGLTGPVKVAGKVYKAPEINGDMPGIGQSKEFTDSDIAELLNFIRHSWSNKGKDKISPADVTNTRTKLKDRQKPFTTDELNKLK
jgi:mono/diheme cytochrome c family protein/glucose/arabinose dehydrogenase